MPVPASTSISSAGMGRASKDRMHVPREGNHGEKQKSGVGLSHHVKIVQSHMYNHQLIVTLKKINVYIYICIYIYCALPPPCNSRKNRWIGRRSLLQQMAIIWGL